MKARNTRNTTPVFIKTPNPFRSIGGGDMKSPSETADCCGKGKQSESEITSLQELWDIPDCLEDARDERLRHFCGLLDAKATRGNRSREFSFASQGGRPV